MIQCLVSLLFFNCIVGGSWVKAVKGEAHALAALCFSLGKAARVACWSPSAVTRKLLAPFPPTHCDHYLCCIGAVVDFFFFYLLQRLLSQQEGNSLSILAQKQTRH